VEVLVDRSWTISFSPPLPSWTTLVQVQVVTDEAE
jgi:hypothetical protein